MSRAQLQSRVEGLVRNWRVVVDYTLETESSFLAFGRRRKQPVVLKVLRNQDDSWCSGETWEAFEGRGVVRVYEYVEGAVLLERLHPGTSLVGLCLDNRDDEATEILAELVQSMSPRELGKAPVTVEDWAQSFEAYSASSDTQIPRSLVEEAHRRYLELSSSQSRRRLLHGDLHHSNVLFDSDRGWLAVDPKGVVGEIEYEIGAALRNPYQKPELFTHPSTVQRRLRRFASKLNLDFRRALAWGFAQSVLAAIWEVEDRLTIDAASPYIALAKSIRPMLGARAEI